MRLATHTLEHIDRLVHAAWAAERHLEVPAPSRYVALKMMEAVTPHVEARGGEREGLGWRFANGSRIVLAVIA